MASKIRQALLSRDFDEVLQFIAYNSSAKNEVFKFSIACATILK